MGEKRSNHTVYNVNYHFVWYPKSSKAKLCVHRGISDPAQYRHPILGAIEDSLESSFREVCDDYSYEILSLHISSDHVHLFLSAHPKYAPTEIVRTVKSITAREMWQQHESLLQEYLWGGGFWEESYYVGTAGDVSTDTIEQYIERTEHV